MRTLRTSSPFELFDRLEQQLSQQLHSAEHVPAAEVHESPEAPAPLLSEFRYGTRSRSFRFPQPIERDQLQAVYRDGLLTVTAPKAHKVISVTMQVEG